MYQKCIDNHYSLRISTRPGPIRNLRQKIYQLLLKPSSYSTRPTSGSVNILSELIKQIFNGLPQKQRQFDLKTSDCVHVKHYV